MTTTHSKFWPGAPWSDGERVYSVAHSIDLDDDGEAHDVATPHPKDEGTIELVMTHPAQDGKPPRYTANVVWDTGEADTMVYVGGCGWFVEPGIHGHPESGECMTIEPVAA